METTKIVREVSCARFQRIVSKYASTLCVSNHALAHLSATQRKPFREAALMDILLKERPYGVGLQRNGRYAAFYRRKWGFLRIIVGIKSSRIKIITFINTESIPNLKRLDHEK